MNLTCQQRDLAHALSVVSHAVSARSTLPILSHVLMATTAEGLLLSATDLELSLSVPIAASVQATGALCLPASLLTALVKRLPAGPLTLTVDEQHTATLTSMQTCVTVHGTDPTEFPCPSSPQASLC
jgi:DNA polymerase-3 subunit beta